MADWDRRFMDLAQLVASWSKDRSTKVGCVIIGPHREIRSVGFNGFPRGANDDVECRHERPLKYKWTEHAERNAIYNATLTGTSLFGCTAYVPWFPCADCARALIQAGITTMVAYPPNFDDPRWGEDFRMVEQMLKECEVTVRIIPKVEA